MKERRNISSISSMLVLNLFWNANANLSYGHRKKLSLYIKIHKYLDFTHLLNTAAYLGCKQLQ